MTDSNIFFIDPGPEPTARITQLFPHLELFTDGEPARNTLFVQSVEPSRLLIIDPPADTGARFRLEGDVATLFTGPSLEAGLPQVQTQPGGVAHLRIGEHFLDVYSQRHSNVVHFPALGMLCGGGFGSDVLLPRIAAGSDGRDEVDTLRMLASLLKRKHFQLFLPAYGSHVDDNVEAMKRLAADVAYLNGLMRLVAEGLERDDAIETIEVTIEAACDGFLPAERNSDDCREIHDANVERLIAANRQV